MRKTKPVLAVLALSVATVLHADIGMSGVTATPMEGTALVKIDYVLDGGPAIVTLDVTTNGVSVGGAATRHVSGDVNRLVSKTSGTIYWMAGSAWPVNVDPSSVGFSVKAWSPSDPPPYMAVCLSVTNQVRYYASADAFPAEGGVTNILYKTDWLVMRKIPAAGVVWKMGLNATDTATGGSSRSTSHKVTFTCNYYMGIYELTRRQASFFTSSYSSSSGTSVSAYDDRPYASATYSTVRGSSAEGYDWPKSKAVKEASVIGRLRRHCGIAFDLPTDAQWEYACRAGEPAAFNHGYNALSDKSRIEEVAWIDEDSAQPVGLRRPNNWGLYDMHGNVWEMMLDWCRTTLADETDPEGPESISIASGKATIYKAGNSGTTETVGRAIRGCHFARWRQEQKGDQIRSAHRNWAADTTSGAYYGYRLACPCPAEGTSAE